MSGSGDDRELMLRYRAGDTAAFETLYQRHRGPLYRYCLRQTRSPERAADLFQEIWRRLIDHRHRYRPSARFTTYLYRIAHSCAVDLFRRARHQPIDLAVPDEAERLVDRASHTPEQAAERVGIAARLRAALAELPAEQREAFLLREEAGLTLQEIAEVTGVGAETAKSRLRYAVRKLRQALRAEGDELMSIER